MEFRQSKKEYKNLFDVYKEPFFLITLIVMILCSIVSLFYNFTFDGGNGTYLVLGGPAVYPLYIASVFFVLYFIFTDIVNK